MRYHLCGQKGQVSKAKGYHTAKDFEVRVSFKKREILKRHKFLLNMEFSSKKCEKFKQNLNFLIIKQISLQADMARNLYLKQNDE